MTIPSRLALCCRTSGACSPTNSDSMNTILMNLTTLACMPRLLKMEPDSTLFVNSTAAASDGWFQRCGFQSRFHVKKAWTEVNRNLTAAFERFTPEDWLQKHTEVSDEDFAKDPTR